jgi:hypothetical protein
MNDLVNLARTIIGRNFLADEWQLYFPGEEYRKTFPDLPGPDGEPDGVCPRAKVCGQTRQDPGLEP